MKRSAASYSPRLVEGPALSRAGNRFYEASTSTKARLCVLSSIHFREFTARGCVTGEAAAAGAAFLPEGLETGLSAKALYWPFPLDLLEQSG